MTFRKWIVRGIVALLVLVVVLLAISALLNLNLPTQSTVVDHLSPAEKAHLAEFFHVRQALGDAAFPGWGGTDIPVLVYNEAYAFLIGYPGEPPDGWLKVPQNTSRGGPWEVVPGDTFDGGSYYRQSLVAGAETPQAFTVKVGERWVASLLTKEWMEISLANQFRQSLPSLVRPFFPYTLVGNIFLRGSDGYIAGLAHESFHAYQGTVAPQRLAASERTTSRGESSYPWYDGAFEEAWQAELDLLAEALRAETEAESLALAQQFLAQRARRRQEADLSTSLIDYERQREWLEGLARYVELESWRQASLAEAYQPLPAIQDVPGFSDYDTYERRWSQELDQIGRMADDEGDGRFYYSGMAQAVLLDRLAPEWKDQALREDVFLEDLLANALQQVDASTH